MKKGELLMLSTEEYSDQCHAGPFEVLKDFNISEVAEQVKNMEKLIPESWRDKNGPDDVIKFLQDNFFIKEVSCRETHLGSYGDIRLTGDLA